MSRWSVEGLETDLDHFRLGPVSLSLEPGRSLVVLGSSGAGKTTLLRALGGFLPARKGRILRDGLDISEYPPERRRLGYVPQGLGLFPHRTVARNIRYPIELTDRTDGSARTRELLERFHLTALADRYPSRLSGGELQRVAIARALAADPELILWDEPWQALDVLARHELSSVWEELRARDSVPIVVVTHDPALAFSIGDRFVLLANGRVRRQCGAQELLQGPTDAFTARFIGFENVVDRTTLGDHGAGPLAEWLKDHAGSGGIAFPSPALTPESRRSGRWTGRVVQCRPGPGGVALEVASEKFILHLRIPGPVTAPPPIAGTEVRFDLDDASAHPLSGGPSEGM